MCKSQLVSVIVSYAFNYMISSSNKSELYLNNMWTTFFFFFTKNNLSIKFSQVDLKSKFNGFYYLYLSNDSVMISLLGTQLNLIVPTLPKKKKKKK